MLTVIEPGSNISTGNYSAGNNSVGTGPAGNGMIGNRVTWNNQVEKIERLYAALPEKRRELICTYVISEEEYRRIWEQQPYERKDVSELTTEFYTDRGEKVRSKSEVLIANTLNRHKIPYRYEAPLYLNGIGIVHPDFAILQCHTRREFYWEHLGMLDDREYRDSAMDRVNLYQKNGYYPGESLIITHETLHRPLDLRLVNQLVEHYFL